MGKTFRKGSHCREGRYARNKELQRVYLVIGDPTTEHHLVRVTTLLRKISRKPSEPNDDDDDLLSINV